jgi:PAS domain S-box-containing protein
MGCSYMYFLNQREVSYKMIHRIHNVSYKIFSLNAVEQDFVHYDSKKPTYHFTHTSTYIKMHQQLIEDIDFTIQSLLNESLLDKNDSMKIQLKEVLQEIEDYQKTFGVLIGMIEKRGTHIYGLEGELMKRKESLQIYKSLIGVEIFESLMQNAKDYFISKDSIYVFKNDYLISELKKNVLKPKGFPINIQEKASLALDDYLKTFKELVIVERSIGYSKETGLLGRLIVHNQKIRKLMSGIEKETVAFNESLKEDLKNILFGVLFICILISLGLSFFFSSMLTKPIRILTAELECVVNSNFTTGFRDIKFSDKDEVGVLSRRFISMVATIQDGMREIKEYSNRIEKQNVALLKSELDFRSTFEQAAVGIAHIDFTGTVLRVNKKLCEILGFSSDKIPHLNASRKFIRDTIEKNGEQYEKLLLNTEEYITLEQQIKHYSGKMIWVYLTCSMKFDKYGIPEYQIWVVQDISERKKAESELMYKNQELDTFCYKVSHDLKGPVASLKGLCSTARMEVKDPVASEYFGQIGLTLSRLNEIICNLIELTKIKEGQIDLTLIDPEILIRNSLAILLKTDCFQKIDFTIDSCAANELFSDSRYLNTIFLNLLENALKYSKKQEDSFIRVTISDHKKGVLVTFEDNGIGIERAFQSKVFDMFFRATDFSKGSGLGLYLVKNAIEKLNGTIDLKSEAGKGTTFFVYLPNLKKKELKVRAKLN